MSYNCPPCGVAFLVGLTLMLVSVEHNLAQSVATPRLVQVDSLPNNHCPWPRNGLALEMQDWELILDRTAPYQFDKTLTASELIHELNEAGLPFVLDQSAIDDALNEDERVQIPLPDCSLRTRLIAALKFHNATIVFRDDCYAIVSLDDESDPKFLLTITYDLTRLNVNARVIVGVICSVIANDSWLENGGVGSVARVNLRGRELLLISQTYTIHREIQSLLRSVDRLGGLSRAVPATRSVSFQQRGSVTSQHRGSASPFAPHRSR